MTPIIKTQVFPVYADDFFAKPFGADDFFLKPRVLTVPSVNIRESNNDYVIEFAAPGLAKNDFKIDMNKNILSISNRKPENDSQAKADSEYKYNRCEFSYHDFEKRFTLPRSIDKEKITANYSEGVLYVTLPKLATENQQREISID